MDLRDLMNALRKRSIDPTHVPKVALEIYWIFKDYIGLHMEPIYTHRSRVAEPRL